MIISDKPHKLCNTFTTVLLYLLQGVCHRKARRFGTNGTIWISTANHADATDTKLYRIYLGWTEIPNERDQANNYGARTN